MHPVASHCDPESPETHWDVGRVISNSADYITLCLSLQILTLEDQTSVPKHSNIFPKREGPVPVSQDQVGWVCNSVGCSCKVKVEGLHAGALLCFGGVSGQCYIQGWRDGTQRVLWCSERTPSTPVLKQFSWEATALFEDPTSDLTHTEMRPDILPEIFASVSTLSLHKLLELSILSSPDLHIRKLMCQAIC